MDQFALQRYFRSMCDALVIAYTESQRLLKKEDRTVEEERNFYAWAYRARKKKKEIEELIVELITEDKFLIVNTKEEIIALLFFYGVQSVEKWRIIDEEEVSLMDFPNDEFSLRFKKAYFSKNQEEINKLLEEYAKKA